MSDPTMQLDAFGRALVGWLGPMNLWTGLLLAGALVLDRMLAHRAHASWRIALYAPIALRVVLPLGWTIHLAHTPRVASFLSPLPDGPLPALTELPAAHAFTWPAAVAVAYLAIAALLAARSVVVRVRLDRALRTATPLEAPAIVGRCPVLQHDQLGPMVVGLLHPRIVLPRKLVAEGGAHALDCVLRHERAHMQRRDALLSAAMQSLAVVAWPVVPLWVGIARVRHLVELACDEAALAHADPAERRKYGHALLDVAEWHALGVTPLGAGELHFGSRLRARIEALASQRHWPLAAQAGLVVLVVVGFAACSSVGPTPPDVATATTPESAPGVHGSPLSHDGSVVVVNGVTLRTEEDLRTRCPHFVARARGAPDFVDSWVAGPTDGIPGAEVALCRDPQVLNIIHENAWSSEARNAIGQIARDIAAAYEQRGPVVGWGPQAFCPSGSPEPAQPQARGAKYRPTSQDWMSPGWTCLRFSMDQPFYFQYAYTVDGTHLTITAHAQRPKGDHGEDVTITLHCHIRPDGVLDVAPNLEEVWKDVP